MISKERMDAMKTKKLIKDMTPEERAAYQREWYAKRQEKANSNSVTLTIMNCPDDLKQAIMSFLQESK